MVSYSFSILWVDVQLESRSLFDSTPVSWTIIVHGLTQTALPTVNFYGPGKGFGCKGAVSVPPKRRDADRLAMPVIWSKWWMMHAQYFRENWDARSRQEVAFCAVRWSWGGHGVWWLKVFDGKDNYGCPANEALATVAHIQECVTVISITYYYPWPFSYSILLPVLISYTINTMTGQTLLHHPSSPPVAG